MLIYTDKIIPKQPPEREFGNKEYKTVLVYRYKNRDASVSLKTYIENKSSQLLYRLIEGNSKAIYMLGIKDNGIVWGMTQEEMQKTLDTLRKMTESINAKIKSIRVYQGGRGFVCSVRIYLNEKDYQKKVINSIV